MFDRIERARIEEGQPRQTISATLDHTVNRFSATVHTQRFGQVGVRGATASLDQKFGAKWLTDVNASYSLMRQLHLTIGSNNIFDEYPDRNIPANSNVGIFPYNQVSPFGFNGRFIYGRVRYDL